MIKSFKHRGLKRLFYDNDPGGVPAHLVLKLRLILGRLNATHSVSGMIMPKYRLHPLKGNLKGYWSIHVTGNLRLIFGFNEANREVFDVNLIDYH